MKKQNSREMSGEKPAGAGKLEVKTKRLVCRKECVAPGYGAWRTGDVITDPALIERFEKSPYFETEEV